MFISKPGVRAISFGEMLTSRNLYIVLAIFAMGALAAFVYTGQSTNSVATINTTLSEPEAVKIKLNGVNIIAMANLPGNTTLSLAGITSALPVNATGTYDLSGTDKKIVVGVLGSNQTTAFAGAPYVNNSSVYSTADRATASRILISNTNLGQDLLGYDYAGTGAVLGTASAYIYVSNANGAGVVAGTSGVANTPAPVGFVCGSAVTDQNGLAYTTTTGSDGKCWTSQWVQYGSVIAPGYYNYTEATVGFTTPSGGLAGNACQSLGTGWDMPTDVQASALIIGSNPWIDVTTGGGYNMFWTQTVSSPGAHVTYTSPGGMGTYSDGGYRNLLCVYN